MVRTDRSFARRIAAVFAAGALVLAACGGDDGDSGPGTTAAPATTAAPGTVTTEPGEEFPSSPGLDDCAENPTTCNSGSRAEGGVVTWVVDQGHDAVFNVNRPDGGSVYLLQAFEGLFPRTGYFAPSGEWTWDYDLLADEPQLVNQDPMTIVYNIRAEAVWSDGTPISVDDFLWNWNHNSGDETKCTACLPRSTAAWGNVANVEGSNNGKTVTITLTNPDPEWYARYGPGYPAHWTGDDINDPDGMTASSDFFHANVPDWSGGPYLVQSWDPNERIVMVPNPLWYGAIKPSVDRLVKEIVTDRGSWLPAIQNREVDGGSPASFTPELLEDFARANNVYTSVGSGGAVWEHIDFNLNRVPDKALRQAIFTAIDVQDARGRIFSAAATPPLRGHHVFTSASPNYVDNTAGTGFGSGDAAAARAILEAAGYTGFEGNGSTLTAPDGTPVPPIEFSFLAANQNRAIFVELTQSYLADIGITVVPSPTDALGTTLTGGDYDLVIFGWSGSPVFTQAPFQYWHSGSGSNFGGLNNADVDRLVDEARSQTDISVSVRMIHEASKIVIEEAYVLPMWDSLNFMFVHDSVANIRDNHFSSLRSQYNLAEWGVLAN